MFKNKSFAMLLGLLIQHSVSAETMRIPHEIPFRHQLNTATCWVHCGIATLDLRASEMFGLRVSFSADALLLQEIRTRALSVFLGHETPWDPGAGMTRLYALALEHGIIPESVWKSRLSLAAHYSEIFREIELVVRTARALHSSPEAFLRAVDFRLRKYVGRLPPEQFAFNGQTISGIELAKRVIDGDSMAYEFRPLPYNAEIYGRVKDVAWTRIISQQGDLIPMTSVIAKKTVMMRGPDEALEKVREIFGQQRPIFLTFITNDETGESTYGVSAEGHYLVKRSLDQARAYSGSHFVLITGIDADASGRITGLRIRDSVTRGLSDERERFMSREFFATLGKTVHTIGLNCERTLQTVASP